MHSRPYFVGDMLGYRYFCLSENKKTKTMKTRVLFLLVLLSVMVKGYAQEEESRFSFELNSGVSFATSELGDVELKPGFGFEGVFHYQLMQHWGLYAGWGWNKLTSKEEIGGEHLDFEETGYVFGVQYKHPVSELPLKYYLRAGGLYNHIETESSEGTIVDDTGHGLGWQIAGGVEVDLGGKWSLVPGFKFNSLSRSTDYFGTSTDLDLNYISLRVGILKKF
jgi:hypothetical protein